MNLFVIEGPLEEVETTDVWEEPGRTMYHRREACKDWQRDAADYRETETKETGNIEPGTHWFTYQRVWVTFLAELLRHFWRIHGFHLNKSITF